MNREELIQQIRRKKSYLCVGLDTDIKKIPAHLLREEDPVFSFNKAIIDATQAYCVSYKLNTAFYESQGVKGWQAMEKTLAYIPSGQFTIADAKRGDIGNTSTQYAKAFFEQLSFHSITVAPYMGRDSVEPFLQFDGKWAIVLALTSNEGAFDFQFTESGEGPLYLKVLQKVSTWGHTGNLMFVVGATKAEQLKQIRQWVPGHFLLIPGVGAQGGSLDEVSRHGMNEDVGILVNVSRQILYASNGTDFAEAAEEQARLLQEQMKNWLPDPM
ncbi:MAG TPA: orotidine-5'-phosphate decarboxylase [Chitinophagaceae bacterium]|nr:orotidine-5'-phosphate decarboxylase [Chitinophagaceae bacterium]